MCSSDLVAIPHDWKCSTSSFGLCRWKVLQRTYHVTLSLAEKLTAWKLEPQETAKVSMEIISLVEDLAQRLFNDYEPAEISNFYMRLDKWLSNFAEEEKQKLLLRMITHIFFVGKKEFNSLFRSAYRGSITRWIIDAANLDILNETYIENLGTALKGTWFCPLTDSFRINSFLKINSCSGHDLRPDWLSLHHLGSIDKINRYMSENGIARIVLLEDFIGSSDQVLNVVEAACSSFSAVQFLVCATAWLCPLV